MSAVNSSRRYVVAMAVATVATILYVSSYYATVEREDLSLFLASMIPRMDEKGVQPRYRFGNNVLTGLFAPIHTVDRLLRPDFWLVHDKFAGFR
jgi:hypothetical protein